MVWLKYRRSYRRNLPHLQPQEGTFFLTFRLEGSLPQVVLTRWRQERGWLAKLATRNILEYEKEKLRFERKWFSKFENLLDSSESGPHWLRNPEVAILVANEFRESDNKWFRLDAYTIMTNHVHAVFNLSRFRTMRMTTIR